jgi:Domain of unknown function (DUF4279)
VRADQYVYFAVRSDEVTALEVEERLGLRPDSVLVRGSKDPDRPLPAQHKWAVESQQRDRSLSDQIEEVLARIAPVEAALTDLLSEGRDISYELQVVRVLNDPDAPEQETLPLGFGFDLGALQLLARLDARIDVDEYDGAAGED